MAGLTAGLSVLRVKGSMPGPHDLGTGHSEVQMPVKIFSHGKEMSLAMAAIRAEEHYVGQCVALDAVGDGLVDGEGFALVEAFRVEAGAAFATVFREEGGFGVGDAAGAAAGDEGGGDDGEQLHAALDPEFGLAIAGADFGGADD